MYIVGCNAWGQASLSFAASLVPKLLGFQPFVDREEEECANFLSIRRFTGKRFSHGGSNGGSTGSAKSFAVASRL